MKVINITNTINKLRCTQGGINIMNIDKQEIKNRLKEVLIYYGFKPPIKDGYNWTCLESRHNNPTNNLTVTGNFFCCHCNLKGDVFSLIGEMENLNTRNKDDFKKILNKATEILNVTISNNSHIQKRNLFNNEIKDTEQKQNSSLYEERSFKINDVLTTIITENFEKRNQKRDIYFYKRGFSKGIINKYKLMVYNPNKLLPKEIVPQLNNISSYEYIIPIWENEKVVNCILRRNDWRNKENNKTLNLKNINLKIMNLDYLNQENDYLFICEGWADCLSFETEGLKAISINSINMINKLFESIKHQNTKNTMFYICLDNDKYGQAASIKLHKMLKESNYKSKIIKFNYKDVNEFYVKDKNLFKKSLKGLIS